MVKNDRIYNAEHKMSQNCAIRARCGISKEKWKCSSEMWKEIEKDLVLGRQFKSILYYCGGALDFVSRKKTHPYLSHLLTWTGLDNI